MSFVWQVMSHETYTDDWNIFQPSCNILLFEIFQSNVQIDFENQQKYDALLCPKGLAQNSGFGVCQAKMT